MHKLFLLAILLTAPLLAGPLRFSPDTICAGNTKGCTVTTTRVRNLSNDSAPIVLAYELSPISSYNEVLFYSPSQIFHDWYSTISNIKVETGYREDLHAHGGYGVAGFRLAPHDSTVLSGFQFGTCFFCLSTEGGSMPNHLGNGELVALVFGVEKTGYDTLYTWANQWVTGATQARPTPSHQDDSKRYSIDGRATRPFASGRILGTEGGRLLIR